LGTKKKAGKPIIGRDNAREKMTRLGLIQKIGRSREDTTPLNTDRATPRLHLPGLFQSTRTEMTHRQQHKQDKHTTHHRHYTCFFNNGGDPKGRL
jgi:hypothetical protein